MTPEETPLGLTLKQDIAEYIQLTKSLTQHPRFGEEASEALILLEELDAHILNLNPASQESYFDEKTLFARRLDSKVTKFKSALLKNIERAYVDRNSAAFKLGLREYKAIGGDQELAARWLALEDTADSVFRKLREAEEHKRQKDFESELLTLQEVAALGFLDEGLNERVRELKVLSRDLEITRQIKRAQALYSSGEFSQAKAGLSALLEEHPGNMQAQALAKKTQIALDESIVNALVKKAAQAVVLDDWDTAGKMFTKVLETNSENKNAIDGRHLAKGIIEVKTRMRDLFNAPERLSDPQVAQYANELLEESAEYFDFSDSLHSLAKKLELAIVERNRPAQILIKSDGKARIEVRGIGYIEPSLEKTIELLPGNYAFYAHCKGRVVQQVLLEVPVNQPVIGLSVVCGREI